MITPDIEQRLKDLNSAFLEENSKLNLSAFRTEESCWIGNVMDSLAALDVKIFTDAASILDIGTGGGFPLLPLAICLPDTNFTGMDSTEKKIEAIQRILDKMSIPNVSLICGRAEELGRNSEYREKFDIITARGIAALNTLLEYCAPFAKEKGFIVAWKSLNIDQEMKDSLLARAELSCHLDESYKYELPEDFGKRQLLIFNKTSKTSDKYPRVVGMPKKNPLL